MGMYLTKAYCSKELKKKKRANKCVIRSKIEIDSLYMAADGWQEFGHYLTCLCMLLSNKKLYQ